MTLLSCGYNKPKSSSTRGIARIMCDESFESVLEQEIAVFEYQYPEASIMPDYINEHDALDSLFQNRVDLIIISHDLTPDQKKSLKKLGRGYRSKMIAVDAIAIIVNKQNDIAELSMEDLRDIFTGKVKRWGEVYPTKLKNDTIKVMFDGSGTGVVHYMKDKFLNGGIRLRQGGEGQGGNQRRRHEQGGHEGKQSPFHASASPQKMWAACTSRTTAATAAQMPKNQAQNRPLETGRSPTSFPVCPFTEKR